MTDRMDRKEALAMPSSRSGPALGIRLRLIVTAALAAFGVAAVGASAASAAVTITQTDSADPVAQGTTVNYTVTVVSDVAVNGLHVSTAITRPGSRTPVDNRYLAPLTSSRPNGSCTSAGPSTADCSIAGTHPAGEPWIITASIQANESMQQVVTGYTCTAPPACDFHTDLGIGVETTQVDLPPRFRGSQKIKIKGLPSTSCASGRITIKAKAKAKKVNRFFAYLNGPKTEWGTPLLGDKVSGKIKKTENRKLKVTLPTGLDPGFYQLKLVASQKGGSKLKRTATFQVCGPQPFV